jgi:hypothetical protein
MKWKSKLRCTHDPIFWLCLRSWSGNTVVEAEGEQARVNDGISGCSKDQRLYMHQVGLVHCASTVHSYPSSSPSFTDCNQYSQR